MLNLTIYFDLAMSKTKITGLSNLSKILKIMEL